MAGEAELRVVRARALIGTRFRLHGRDPATGLDCVGLCAVAAGITHVPTGYPLRGGNLAAYQDWLNAYAVRQTRAMQAGDIVLFDLSAAQYHLGIWAGQSLIHAHAGLRRVVETPGAPEGACVGCWVFSY